MLDIIISSDKSVIESVLSCVIICLMIIIMVMSSAVLLKAGKN